ncbi:MAG TPA: hypothetical protein VLR26_17760 [Frankiaceae bacterium]|nr:hypothetical protein [Frankiaceae bacterium]
MWSPLRLRSPDRRRAAPRPVDGAGDGGRQRDRDRDRDDLVALVADSEDAVAMFVAEVVQVRAGGFEHSKAE